MPHLGTFKFQAPVNQERKGQKHVPLSVSLSISLLPPPCPFAAARALFIRQSPPSQPRAHLGAAAAMLGSPLSGQCSCCPQAQLSSARSMPILNAPLLGGDVLLWNVKKEPVLKDFNPPGTYTASKEQGASDKTVYSEQLVNTPPCGVLLRIPRDAADPSSTLHQLPESRDPTSSQPFVPEKANTPRRKHIKLHQ